jgi:hypothetical protein
MALLQRLPPLELWLLVFILKLFAIPDDTDDIVGLLIELSLL